MRRLLVLVISSALLVPATGPASTARAANVEPGLLDAVAPVEVLARFERDVPALPAGVTVHYRFANVPAVYATATPDALEALAARGDLAYLEASKQTELLLDTATVASRTRDVFDPPAEVAPLLGSDGAVIDGRGVGIAIVDSGLDGLHPDFEPDGKIGGNWFVTPAGLVPAAWTAAGSTQPGHGTHVAGIAAGTGILSGGRYRGAAPGATLYAFNFNYTGTVYPAIAFDWILQHGHEQDPPIKIVNNSWRCVRIPCGHPFNGDQLHNTLASMLAEAGITVVWAAGNDGGDGTMPYTTAESANPTPGNISVGNYHDEGTGRRDLCLSGSSSQGASLDPTTWPDVVAPGRDIMSTFALAVHQRDTASFVTRNPVTGDESYRELTGTSMAAPHVAGTIALLLQADPALTPAEIEYILKQTATPLTGDPSDDGCGIDYVRADPAHPWTGANYAAGHGLIDAYAAVGLARGFDGIPALIDPEPLPSGFIRARPGVEVERALYLMPDGSLDDTYPDGTVPSVVPLEPNVSAVFLSEPFDQAASFDGFEFDAYVGSDGELVLTDFTPPRVSLTLAIVKPSGARIVVGSDQQPYWRAAPVAPHQREAAFVLDDPVTIGPGDRLRATVAIISPPLSGVDPPPEAFGALYLGHPTPSQIGLGRAVRVPDPQTRTGCETRQDCATVDATHPLENMVCGPAVYRITWYGPPGSSIAFSCETFHQACVVPGMPGDPWGSCEAQLDLVAVPFRTMEAGICTYRTPDGARAGSGRCVGLSLIED